jgi:hypothetical protein
VLAGGQISAREQTRRAVALVAEQPPPDLVASLPVWTSRRSSDRALGGYRFPADQGRPSLSSDTSDQEIVLADRATGRFSAVAPLTRTVAGDDSFLSPDSSAFAGVRRKSVLLGDPDLGTFREV